MTGQQPVPMADLEAEVRSLAPELLSAASRVLLSGRYILGPEVDAFESEMASYLGVAHAIGVNSGTDALVIALRALGVGPGDEVVTASFGFFATAEAIVSVGARPLFVDIDPVTLNIDPDRVGAALTDRVRAVIPVHLFGRPAAMDELGTVVPAGVAIVEDCAQALGARVGERMAATVGAAGTLSFFPSKTLGGFGDGGMLVSDDPSVARTARMLRAHGGIERYRNELFGYNSRLDALQAALLRVKLPTLDAVNDARRAVAGRYGELFADEPRIQTPAAGEHVYHQYTVRVPAPVRDALRAALADRGIATMVYYPTPIHRLPVFGDAHADVALPETERAASEVMSLPIWPGMPDETIERVAVEVVDLLGGLVRA